MPSGRNKSPAEQEAYARNHPVRLRILELYAQDEGRSLAAQDLMAKLGGEKTTPSAVAYHVRVLKHAGLLPDAE